MAVFQNLFSPGHIGKVEIRNRIVMPPMATNFAAAEGAVTDRHIAYYQARARGGVGVIIFEHTGIVKQGKAFPNMALIDADDKIPPFRKLIQAVHEEGAKIFIQINHAGRQTSPSITGCPIVAPSPIPCPVRQEMPRALSPGEIQDLVWAYAAAARRAKDAGADGVEIHMAHGYLLNQFLSPFSNRREDEYGGDPKRRLRAPLEVLRGVRREVGSAFPVTCRFSADEYVDGGLRIEASKEIAQALEENGADALHVTGGIGASWYMIHPPYYAPEGVFVPLASAVKSVLPVPVITDGRIRTPELADRVIKENGLDFVSMGRALIADPGLPGKARQGLETEIRPCISCTRCPLSIRKGAVQCAVNPEAGREESFKLRKAESPKKVWVVGGGPGGMKAAETAARRGHRVTLFERRQELGGQFLLAALPPCKSVLNEFTAYLIREGKKLPIQIHLGTSFNEACLASELPDILIVAAGAAPSFPPIEGIEKSRVFTSQEALSQPDQVGGRVLIIGGGGIGAEIADFLAERGKEVTLVEMREGIALDLVGHLQHFLRIRLEQKNVQLLTLTKVVRLDGSKIWVEDERGTRALEGFDAVVTAVGAKSNDEWARSLKKKVAEVYIIGDASYPREVMEALLEAAETGRDI